MTTLPPRLSDHSFPPDLAAADLVIARARRRRRARASGAAGLVAASVVAVATLGIAGGTVGLRTVDPAGTPSPSGHVASDRPAVAAPSPSATPIAPNAPAASPSTQPTLGGVPPAPPRDPRTTTTRTETVHRETVAYTIGTCSELHTVIYGDHPSDTAHFCLRYSWPTSMTYGKGGTFLVEYCAVDRDVTSNFSDQPRLAVSWGDFEWGIDNGSPRNQTLRVATCWRWTIKWTGLRKSGRPLPRGTYDVQVEPPLWAFGLRDKGTDPNRQNALLIE